MDSVKGKLISLESKIKDLEVKMNSLTGVTPMIEKNNHHVFPSEEFIECNLFEELQTLKFAYFEKNENGKKCYEYYLLNPTDELKEIVEKIGIIPRENGWTSEHINNSTEVCAVILKSFCDSPEKLEDYGYEIIGIYRVERNGVILPSTTSPSLNEKDRKKFKDELDKYFFQVSAARRDTRGYPPLPLLGNVVFSQDITIRFRNEYERLPHISYYLTPIQECLKVKILLKDLTKNQAVFTITEKTKHVKDNTLLSADRYEIPADINLHLYVKGIQKNLSIDILLE